MAFAETANLSVKLNLTGNMNQQLAKTRSALRGFDKDTSRAYKAGAQIGTGIKRGAILAVAGIGALTALVAKSVQEGQAAANVQLVYANAVKNSGKVSADYVKILDAQQAALMQLSGVDDELIKQEQTRLIQMGLTGKQVAKATPLILDFAKATGIDLLTATKLFGKAANGNTGALSRYGVSIDKAKAKVDPFGAAIDALNGKFGGTTKALSGQLDTRLAVLKEGMANIREELGIKLLPVLTRIVDVAGKELVPAFAKFVDRILPDIEDGLNQFADLLDNGGAAKGIQAITDALGPMVDLVRASAGPVKAIVGAFNALPKEVQTVLVGAFAVNKLTGGLVTNAAGGIIGAIAKAALGGIKAPLVNVEGGVVNVAGGVGGIGGGGAAAGAAGGASLIPAVGIAALIVAAAVPIGQAFASALPASLKGPGGQGLTQSQVAHIAAQAAMGAKTGAATNQNANGGNIAARGSGKHFDAAAAALLKTAAALRGIRSRAEANGKNPTDKQVQATLRRNQQRADAAAAVARVKADQIRQAQLAAQRKIEYGTAATKTGAATTSGAVRSGSGQIVGAIRANRPTVITNVKVSVTPAQVIKTTTVQYRYGPATGSSGADQASGLGPGQP